MARLGVAAFIAAAGCPAPEPCDPDAVGEVAFGWPDPPFRPWSAGEPVVVVMGPQGGWHVDVGVEVTGIDLAPDAEGVADLPLATTRVWVEGEPVAGYADLPRVFTGSDLFFERVPFVGDPSGWIGGPATLASSIVDRCGGRAEGELEVQLTAP